MEQMTDKEKLIIQSLRMASESKTINEDVSSRIKRVISSIRKPTITFMLAIAPFIANGQIEMDNLSDASVVNAVENFQKAYQKTGDEKFNLTLDDVKVMNGPDFGQLMIDAFSARGVYSKTDAEVEKARRDAEAASKGFKPGEWETKFRIFYNAPVDNRTAFERAFEKAYKAGMTEFEFGGKRYAVQLGGKDNTGKQEVKILPAHQRDDIRTEARIREYIRKILRKELNEMVKSI